MNLNNDGEVKLDFEQYCYELAKLLRTDQTVEFLRLYDSLPSEWNGLLVSNRSLSFIDFFQIKFNEEYLQLETGKKEIRDLQDLGEDEFQLGYQRAFEKRTNTMSNPPKQSSIIHNDDQQQIMTTASRITSLPLLQQKQHHERMTANNLACDETHDLIKFVLFF